jgi:hypothetical protein
MRDETRELCQQADLSDYKRPSLEAIVSKLDVQFEQLRNQLAFI